MSNVKNQHYIWRHYLSEWSHNEHIFSFNKKNKEVYDSPLKKEAKEKYFYESSDIGESNVNFLCGFIIGDQPSEEIQPVLLKFIDISMYVYNPSETDEKIQELNSIIQKKCINDADSIYINDYLNKIYKHVKKTSIFLKTQADKNTQNFENIHAAIELNSTTFLREIKNSGKLENRANIVEFTCFLCIQYFRTKKMKDNICNNKNLKNINIDLIWPTLSHVMAIALAYNLLKGGYFIQTFDNKKEIIITGDQPIINTCFNSITGKFTSKKTLLYYPVSPKKGVVFFNKKIYFISRFGFFCLNNLIFENMHEKFFAYKKESFKYYTNDVLKKTKNRIFHFLIKSLVYINAL